VIAVLGEGRWRVQLEPLGPAVLASLPEGVRRNLAGWRGVLAWGEAVSPEVSRRSRAVAFRDGRLIVQVVGSVWMHHLMALKGQLLAQVNQAIGPPTGVIDDIIFVLNPSLAAAPAETEGEGAGA
jgi:predicted nucleic acid-binding Zn ribbon protein